MKNTLLQLAIVDENVRSFNQEISGITEEEINQYTNDIVSPSLLFMAINKQNNDFVTKLLAKGASMDVYDNYGFKPIHRAVYNGNEEIVYSLIKQNRNCVNEPKLDSGLTPGYSAFQLSLMHYDFDIATLLLQFGADINFTDTNGNSALHHAVIWQNSLIINYLIANNINVNLINKEGYAPIHYACMKSAEIVEILKNNDADLECRTNDQMRYTPLAVAIDYGNLIVAQKLIEYQVSKENINVDGINALDFACIKNNLSMIELLHEYFPHYKITTYVENNQMYYISHNLEEEIVSMAGEMPDEFFYNICEKIFS